MIRITEQYFWNFVFVVFFVGLITMGAIILKTEARIAYEDLTFLDALILALATYRVVRLFLNDNITKFFREQFWDTKEMKTKILLVKPESGPRRTIADLLSCPWCFGAWAAAMVLFFYLLTPYAIFPVWLLALAGAGTWLHQVGQLTGYKAEGAKREAE